MLVDGSAPLALGFRVQLGCDSLKSYFICDDLIERKIHETLRINIERFYTAPCFPQIAFLLRAVIEAQEEYRIVKIPIRFLVKMTSFIHHRHSLFNDFIHPCPPQNLSKDLPESEAFERPLGISK